MSIFLTAIPKSKAEKQAELRGLLLNMVMQSRKEDACLQYDLHESADGNYIFQEDWESQSGLDFHNQQSYILDFAAKAADLTIEVVIHQTEKIA